MNILSQGDALQVLRTLGPDSFDGCLTDPPYGLSFMGKAWDHGVPGAETWAEVLRVLKPGAMLLAFGGTRTHHRLMCAIDIERLRKSHPVQPHAAIPYRQTTGEARPEA